MSSCKGCGQKIVWAKTESGKKIPLQKAKFYVLLGDLAAENKIDGFISHFVTCPKANDFSGSNKNLSTGE